jgi:hypothetical protein
VRKKGLLVDRLNLSRGSRDGSDGVAVMTRDQAGFFLGAGKLSDDVCGAFHLC